MKKNSEPYQCLGDKVIVYKFFDELTLLVQCKTRFLILVKALKYKVSSSDESEPSWLEP